MYCHRAENAKAFAEYIIRSLKIYFANAFFEVKIMKLLNYFTKLEIALWSASVLFITGSFFLFKADSILTLTASIIGVSSLIFNAKGNPFGQLLMIIFSILYGIISFNFSYYGEMLTYLGMTCPMALFSLIAWLRHPFNGQRSVVQVNSIGKKECLFMFILSALVTFLFYFILDFFNTANMIPSTISVTTSFIAVYLTFRRSPYFALAYAANDVVLIILWTLAAFSDKSYISAVICFIAFLINDFYGFISWRKAERSQKATV